MKRVNCQHWSECRVAGGGCCAIGHKARPSFGVCTHCDRRQAIPGWQGPPDGVVVPVIIGSALAVVGPKLWAELHGRALAYAGDNIAETKWLAGFAARLPCGDCRNHWRVMVARTPADLTSTESYFAWTVERHNEVNRRLGKPELAIEVARRLFIGQAR